MGKLAAFLSQPGAGRAAASPSGNTPEATAMARDLRAVVSRAVARAPRTVQVHLGPSEIGDPCHRQVAGKLAGLPATNHVTDPWPSAVGTAGHAWLADALAADDPVRWLCEKRVVPIDGHSGTADLYDTTQQAVIDHKLLGRTTHPKVVAGDIPRKYYVQLLLYALGYIRAGFPVRRVMLAAWSRGGMSTALYVWDHLITTEDWQLIAYVTGTELPYRKQCAELIRTGQIRLLDVPIGTDKPDCYFCPFFRPEAARNPEVAGCPGVPGHH